MGRRGRRPGGCDALLDPVPVVALAGRVFFCMLVIALANAVIGGTWPALTTVGVGAAAGHPAMTGRSHRGVRPRLAADYAGRPRAGAEDARRRSVVLVEVDLRAGMRLPGRVEVAAYYVV